MYWRLFKMNGFAWYFLVTILFYLAVDYLVKCYLSQDNVGTKRHIWIKYHMSAEWTRITCLAHIIYFNQSYLNGRIRTRVTKQNALFLGKISQKISNSFLPNQELYLHFYILTSRSWPEKTHTKRISQIWDQRKKKDEQLNPTWETVDHHHRITSRSSRRRSTLHKLLTSRGRRFLPLLHRQRQKPSCSCRGWLRSDTDPAPSHRPLRDLHGGPATEHGRDLDLFQRLERASSGQLPRLRTGPRLAHVGFSQPTWQNVVPRGRSRVVPESDQRLSFPPCASRALQDAATRSRQASALLQNGAELFPGEILSPRERALQARSHWTSWWVLRYRVGSDHGRRS